MAGNARFHDKLHRKNHHSIATVGYADSATDPIASREEPFQGDFVVNGMLSSSLGIDLLSANFTTDVEIGRDAHVGGVMRVDEILYINQLSGTSSETIFSDSVVLGNGENTFTVSYANGVYVNTPLIRISNNMNVISSLTVGNYISANNYLLVNNPSSSNNIAFLVKQNSENNIIARFSSDIKNDCFEISKTSINVGLNLSASENFLLNKNLSVLGNTILNNVLINGSVSTLGDVSVIETSILATSALSVINYGTETGLTIQQFGESNIADFKSGENTILKIDTNGLAISGNIYVNGNISSSNINILQSTSGNWDQSYTGLTSTSANWNQSYTALTNTSGNWDQSYTALTNTSADWDQSYTVLTSASGNWDQSYTALTSTSGNWDQSYTALTNTSGNWDQSYTALTSASGNWNQSYTALTSASGNWDQSYTALTSTSGNWDQSYTVLIASSAEWIRPKTTYVSISSVYSNTSLTINLELSSPKFWCLSADNTTIEVNLPVVNFYDTGLIYEFKNNYVGGSNIINVNSNSVLLNVVSGYTKVVFNGDEWIIINVA